MVLIHFWAPDCVPCLELDQAVFSRPSVGNVVDEFFVPVRINARQEPGLALQYQVDRWPTDVVITPDGQLVHKMVSPQDPRQYIAALSSAAARVPAPRDHQVVTTSWPSQGALAAPRDTARQAPWGTYAPPSPAAASAPDQLAGSYANPPAAASRYPTEGTSPMGPPPVPQALPQSSSGGPEEVVNHYASSYRPAGATPQHALAAQYAAPAVHAPYGRVPQHAASYAPQPQFAGPPAVVPQRPAHGALETPPGNNQAADRYQPAPDGSVYAYDRSADPPPRDAAGNWPPERPGMGGTEMPVDSAAGNSMAATPPAAQPQPGATRPENPPQGLEGYCPVTLIEQSLWQKGDARWGAIHRGRTYLFASEPQQQRFLANPDRYSPVMSGIDPVQFSEGGLTVDGKRKHGVLYKDQMYLFADEASLERFWSAPEKYTATIRQAMQPATGGTLR
jgi:YHS domain-containing protein/thiol-disulfide isomerase/thioredoxin